MRQLRLFERRSAATTVEEVLPEPAPEPASELLPSRPRDASWMAVELGRRMRRVVHVTVTENRSTMVSHRKAGGVLRVRLHRAFLDADSIVHDALAMYFENGAREAGRVIDAFIRGGIQRVPVADAVLRPAGRFHDLGEIWAEHNRIYFHGASVARITWGTAAKKRWRRTIQLGCYVADERLIRIHPSLDQVFVPRHYVAWIVFHEMLHEVFGIEERGGRRSVHPPEFMAIEESYPDYASCKEWEAKHLPRLLAYRG